MLVNGLHVVLLRSLGVLALVPCGWAGSSESATNGPLSPRGDLPCYEFDEVFCLALLVTH
eukprot:2330281-Amphidinium_carterae.1